MPRGLIKANAYYNNLQAREDWKRLANAAAHAGLNEQIERLAPPADAGFRRIDKSMERLRRAMVAAGFADVVRNLFPYWEPEEVTPDA